MKYVIGLLTIFSISIANAQDVLNGAVQVKTNSSGTNYLSLGTGGGNTDILNVAANGLVGIGHNTPTTPLDIRTYTCHC